jgi:1,4-alpha-glucan branching enzyme
MLSKMPGFRDDKFANLKVGYTFMMGHPGKKLLFMGQDFGQWHEWTEEHSLDWHLLQEPGHEPLRRFYADLLHLYRKYPCMWEADNNPDSFKWINCDDADRSIFSFMRKSKNGKNNLLFVCNFTPVDRPDYMVGAPTSGTYTLLLDRSGAISYKDTNRKYIAVKGECDGQPYRIAYPLPSYGVAVFRFDLAEGYESVPQK